MPAETPPQTEDTVPLSRCRAEAWEEVLLGTHGEAKTPGF